MTDTNAFLSSLRSFLHTADPTETERKDIYRSLTKNMESQHIWLPMFQEHVRWNQEALVWSHLPELDGGIFRVTGPATTPIEKYADVFPTGPIKVFLQGGTDPHPAPAYKRRDGKSVLFKAPTKLVRRCVHIKVANPEWSMDDTMEGPSYGSADLPTVLETASLYLGRQLRSLHTFELQAAKEFRAIGQPRNMSGYVVQLSIPVLEHTKKDSQYSGYNFHRGIQSLKALIDKSSLKKLHICNRDALVYGYRKATFYKWLSKRKWWRGLESLDMGDNELFEHDFEAMFANAMPELTTLSLANNTKMYPARSQALMRLDAQSQTPCFPKLEHLDLRNTGTSAEYAQRLKASPLLPALKTVLY